MKNLRDIIPLHEISDNARAAMHRIAHDPSSNASPQEKESAKKALSGKLSNDWEGSKKEPWGEDGPDMDDHEGVLKHHGFEHKGNLRGKDLWGHSSKGYVSIHSTSNGTTWSHTRKGKTTHGFFADTLHDSLK